MKRETLFLFFLERDGLKGKTSKFHFDSDSVECGIDAIPAQRVELRL